MQPFMPNIDGRQKQGFLAELQGTRKAVLPVGAGGVVEYKLFNKFMSTTKEFYSSSRGELTDEAVKIWNREAEKTPGVFYKVSEEKDLIPQ